MAQPVWIIGCNSAVNVDLSCPVVQQIIIQTTEAQLTNSGGIPELDAFDVSQVFSLGFGVVVLFFLVGRGVGQVLRLIRYGG